MQAYKDVWTKYDFARYIENSAGLSVAITLITLVVSGMGGYAFARLRFPGREILFFGVLATLMIPDQLRLVPVYQMLAIPKGMLIDTYTGLRAREARARDEPVPDAAVLPDHPEGS